MPGPSGKERPLNRDFAEMLSALSGEGAEFLVVGAFALSAHGYSRATGDIDLWVRPSPENAGRVMTALRKFGAPLHDLHEEDLLEPGTVFQIGVAPLRVDILTSIDGVEFEDAWKAREFHAVDGVTLPCLARRDLIRNKRATGRPQDRVDADLLEGLPE